MDDNGYNILSLPGVPPNVGSMVKTLQDKNGIFARLTRAASGFDDPFSDGPNPDLLKKNMEDFVSQNLQLLGEGKFKEFRKRYQDEVSIPESIFSPAIDIPEEDGELGRMVAENNVNGAINTVMQRASLRMTNHGDGDACTAGKPAYPIPWTTLDQYYDEADGAHEEFGDKLFVRFVFHPDGTIEHEWVGAEAAGKDHRRPYRVRTEDGEAMAVVISAAEAFGIVQALVYGLVEEWKRALLCHLMGHAPAEIGEAAKRRARPLPPHKGVVAVHKAYFNDPRVWSRKKAYGTSGEWGLPKFSEAAGKAGGILGQAGVLAPQSVDKFVAGIGSGIKKRRGEDFAMSGDGEDAVRAAVEDEMDGAESAEYDDDDDDGIAPAYVFATHPRGFDPISEPQRIIDMLRDMGKEPASLLDAFFDFLRFGDTPVADLIGGVDLGLFEKPIQYLNGEWGIDGIPRDGMEVHHIHGNSAIPHDHLGSLRFRLVLVDDDGKKRTTNAFVHFVKDPTGRVFPIFVTPEQHLSKENGRYTAVPATVSTLGTDGKYHHASGAWSGRPTSSGERFRQFATGPVPNNKWRGPRE
jgi:hypothetical protein